jgi:PhoH-like ATPase
MAQVNIEDITEDITEETIKDTKPQKVVIDTNVLIDHPEVLLDKSIIPMIPYTVLAELDNLKRNRDLKRAAQAAIKLLKYGLVNKTVFVTNIPEELTTADEKIVDQAYIQNIPFMSNDIGALAIAIAREVKMMDALEDETINYNYRGYQEVDANDYYNKTIHTMKEMQLPEFEHYMGVNLLINEYCIIHTTPDKYDIWKNINGTMYRISQKMGPYTAAGIKGVQPLDAVQMCALDAVFDPVTPLTVIDGVLGTGKTMLTLMAALAATRGETRHTFYERILVTKPPVSINKDMYTGYKPGSSEEKMSGHLGGIKSNLKFLLDKEAPKKRKKVDDEKETKPSDSAWIESFGIIEIDEIQGTSLHNTILLVDEYQLLDTDTLKLVLSRISENSKVILIGDTAGQTYGMNRADEGFKVLYKYLGKAPEFNYVKLENIYRSKLAKFVENIFTD